MHINWLHVICRTKRHTHHLGQHIVCYISKFWRECDNYFVIGEKPWWKLFDEYNSK